MLGNALTTGVCALLLASECIPVVSIDFDRNVFGVQFSPYVKIHKENGATPGKWTYTMDNLRTLVEVASTKFSKLKTCCVDNHNGVPYVKNSTYYRGTNIVARTAEAAALLNLKRKNKSITVLIGVYSKYYEDDQQWQTGLHVAAEAAEIANKIYTGTVEGIYLYHFDTSSIKWANLSLAGIRKLRSLTAGKGISLGTQQFCHDLPPYEPSGSNMNTRMIWTVRKQIVLASDFFICFRRPHKNDVHLGVESNFVTVSRDIRKGLENVKRINPRITAMCATFWPGLVNNTSLADVKNFKNYWEKSHDFATNYGIRTYIEDAFDSTTLIIPNTGWWRLTNNNLVNNPSAYVERISVLPSPTPTTVKVEIITPGTRFTTKVSSNSGNESVTLRPNLPSTTSKADDKKRSYGFEYGLLAGAIGVLIVVLVGGLIFAAVKWKVQIVSKKARSPVPRSQYTGVVTAPPDSVLCNLQLCLIDSTQRRGLEQDHQN